jgi:hypothetical protein
MSKAGFTMTIKNRIDQLERKQRPQRKQHIYVINPALDGEKVAEAMRKQATQDPGAVVINVVYSGGVRTDIRYPSGQRVSVGVDLNEL